VINDDEINWVNCNFFFIFIVINIYKICFFSLHDQEGLYKYHVNLDKTNGESLVGKAWHVM
jgi:hypothetical protein